MQAARSQAGAVRQAGEGRLRAPEEPAGARRESRTRRGPKPRSGGFAGRSCPRVPISDARCRQRGHSPVRDLCSAKRLALLGQPGRQEGQGRDLDAAGMAERCPRLAAAVFEDLDIGVAAIRLEGPDPVANRRPGRRRGLVGEVDRLELHGGRLDDHLVGAGSGDAAALGRALPHRRPPWGRGRDTCSGRPGRATPGRRGYFRRAGWPRSPAASSTLAARAEGAGFPVVRGAGVRASRHNATGPAAPIRGDQDEAAADGIAADFGGAASFPRGNHSGSSGFGLKRRPTPSRGRGK